MRQHRNKYLVNRYSTGSHQDALRFSLVSVRSWVFTASCLSSSLLVLISSTLVCSNCFTVRYKCASIVSWLCFSWSCLTISALRQPTVWYAYSVNSSRQIFRCSSRLVAVVESPHLFGHGRGPLIHSCLCAPSINWCSPVMPQYWQVTLRQVQSHSMWLAKFCHGKYLPLCD